MSDIRESEVLPRSSGGAPTEKQVLCMHELAFHGGRVDDGEIMRLCDSHEALRTQVSALRQELATGEAHVRELWDRRNDNLDKLEAARQEAARNLKAYEEAADALIAARQEAETLRKSADDLRYIVDVNVPKISDENLRLHAEAETLRGQLNAAQKDTARLDWWEANVSVENGSDYESGYVVLHRRSGGVNDRVWDEIARAETLRAAIDAARLQGARNV
jgi:uncharacterized protein (DUF3084 family)